MDKTFIDDILEDEYAQAFVRLIVELSKTIGTKLVVEGVEHQEQYELLRGLGCIIYRDSILENRQLQKILNKST